MVELLFLISTDHFFFFWPGSVSYILRDLEASGKRLATCYFTGIYCLNGEGFGSL